MADNNAEKALQAIQELMNLHRPDGTGWCVEDGFSWPCSTARFISLVMDADTHIPPAQNTLTGDEQ